MGSTDNKEESGLVDCSVGSIVWVRRRNGSWWPGKILGAEELSAAHLMSPRSGTPVKLLGREDASVDWYNLEKSKRVKAFRCGEFDDCIERAESSLGMPPKKREKYARREDAILHALELEKQLLENKYGILGSSVNCNSSKSCDAVKKELMTSSECSSYDNSKDVNLKPDLEKHDAFLEDKSINNPVCPTNTNEASQPEGDEDNSELLPRMRGLQDFGLKTGLSKQKLSSSISLNGSRKPELDNIAHDLPSSGLSKVNTSSLDIRSSLEKKRKSHEVMTDDILVKRRDRRRPLLQVLQSSEKLPSKSTLQLDSTSVSTHMSGEEQAGLTHHAKRSNLYLPGESTTCSDDDKLVCSDQMARSPSQLDRDDFHHPTPSNEESASESSESTETDSSETDSVDSDGDEEMVDLSDPALITGLEPKPLGISGQVRHGSMTSKFHNYSALESDASHLHSHDTVSASLGVSKWQLKGKRNNRSLARRSTEVTDRWVSRGSMYGTELEYVESDGFDENDIIERNFRNRRRPFHKASSKGLDDVTHNIIDWEDLAWNDQTYMRGYWEDSSNYLDPMLGGHQFGGRMRPRLVDVDLKVQSSYQREHVPMISLMSKINGQAIVGHPIQIEALENGSSDILLSEADGISPEILDNDTALPAVWRTARRTANFRVPRSHPSATLEGEESTEHFQDMDQLKKMPSKRSNVRNFGHRPSMMKKGLSHGSRPMDRKFSRKPSKKISLSSNQKIKNLSAIGKEQKFGNDFRNGSKNSFQVGGLIKGEPGPTAVACIPVKLVYSRLNEELVGRHQ